MHIAIGYTWSNFTTGYYIERALMALGHRVTYVGSPATQRSGYGGNSSIKDILSGLPDKPDCYFWVDSSGPYFPLDIEQLDIPSACYLIDVHLGKWRKQVARFFTHVFVAQKDYVSAFKDAAGHERVYWLPLAASSDTHIRHDLPCIYEVGFVGATGRSHKNTQRVEQLKLLAQHFKINDYTRFYNPHEMSRIYSQSKIVFNTSIAGDITMRVFEGTACGALLLTDSDKNGLEDIFIAGEQLVVYTDISDALDKIRYYLAHETERSQIAEAGYQQTKTHHMYEHRAQTVVDVMRHADQAFTSLMSKKSSDVVGAARREVMSQLGMLDAIFDEARATGAYPIKRLWQATPALVRRVIR